MATRQGRDPRTRGRGADRLTLLPLGLVRLPLAGLAGGSGVGIAGLLLVLVGLSLGLVVVAVLAVAGCALHGRRPTRRAGASPAAGGRPRRPRTAAASAA